MPILGKLFYKIETEGTLTNSLYEPTVVQHSIYTKIQKQQQKQQKKKITGQLALRKYM